jgi:hypothetical protein
MGNAVLRAQGSTTSSDIFSGYFGIEKKYAERIIRNNNKRFVGEGYKFLFDLLKCIPAGKTKIEEVPYIFKARLSGSSKAAIGQGVALLKSYLS